MVNHQKWADFVKTGTVSKPNKQHIKQWIEVYAQFSCPMHMSRTCPVLDGVIWTRRGRHRVGVILGSQPTSPWVTRMAQRGALGCVAGRAAGRAWHPLRHGTVGRSGAEKADAVAPGVCGHRTRTSCPQSRTDRPPSQKRLCGTLRSRGVGAASTKAGGEVPNAENSENDPWPLTSRSRDSLSIRL